MKPSIQHPGHSAAMALQFALRVERKAMRLQGKQIAQRLGSAPCSVSAWELRREVVNLATFCAWARELGLQVRLEPISGEQG